MSSNLAAAEPSIYIGEGSYPAVDGTVPLVAQTIHYPAIPLKGGRISFGIEMTGNIVGTWIFEVTFNGRKWFVQPGADDEWTSNGNTQPAGTALDLAVEFVRPYGKAGRLTLVVASGSGQVRVDAVQAA